MSVGPAVHSHATWRERIMHVHAGRTGERRGVVVHLPHKHTHVWTPGPALPFAIVTSCRIARTLSSLDMMSHSHTHSLSHNSTVNLERGKDTAINTS